MTIDVADLRVKINADEAEAAKAKLAGVGKQVDDTGNQFQRFAGAAVVLGVVVAAGGILVGQINEIAVATARHQAVESQLNAVIKSTGDVSGVTAKQVNDLSESLSKQTTYSVDSVTSAQDLLLTFTSIGKNIFPQATTAVLNMSTALGQDTKSSAIQLGKALQDPLLGMTALRRVGVEFDAEQKALIKTYIEHGEKAKAQAVILQELQKEFGGSAVAAGTTVPGAIAKMNNALEEARVKIGTAVSPVISDLIATRLAPLVAVIANQVTYVIEHGTEVWNKWWPVIVIVGGVIGGLLVAALVAATIAAWAFLQPILVAAAPFIAVGVAIAAVVVVTKLIIDHWSQLTAKAHEVINVFGALFKPQIDAVTGAFHTLVDILDKVLGFLGRVKDAAGGALSVVGKIAGSLGNIHIPGFAVGGVTPGGPILVGESGPEVIIPPAGSRVVPIPATASAPSGGGGRASGPVHIHLQINGRDFAEAILPDLMQPMVAHIRTATGMRL